MPGYWNPDTSIIRKARQADSTGWVALPGLKLVVFGKAGTWNLVDAPGEAVLGASNPIHRAKDDAVADFESYRP